MKFEKSSREALTKIVEEYDDYMHQINKAIIKLERLIKEQGTELAQLEEDLFEAEDTYGKTIGRIRNPNKKAQKDGKQ